MLPSHCNMIKTTIRALSIALGQLMMMLTCQSIEKFGTEVYFTNSLNHCLLPHLFQQFWWVALSKLCSSRLWNIWPQCHCDKKVSIETIREQLDIVMSQLLAAGSCIDDVTTGQHFEIIGNSDGMKCGLTSVKPQESHKWSVHWIHGARNIVQ